MGSAPKKAPMGRYCIRSIGPTEKNDRVKEATEPYGTNWDDNDVREANN